MREDIPYVVLWKCGGNSFRSQDPSGDGAGFTDVGFWARYALTNPFYLFSKNSPNSFHSLGVMIIFFEETTSTCPLHGRLEGSDYYVYTRIGHAEPNVHSRNGRPCPYCLSSRALLVPSHASQWST